MFTHFHWRFPLAGAWRFLPGSVALVAVLGLVLPPAVATAQLPPVPGELEPADDGEVLNRGPVHEAYAEPVSLNAQAGLIIPREPPAAIEEIPPDERPAGDNVAWIPGYWAWDDDRADFMWISGVWRVLPMGFEWVPGYWAGVEGGFQWVPGMWVAQNREDLDYLPPPPASVENGPNSAQPSEDHFWVPGNWTWQTNRYAWKPGFWWQAQPNWVWSPAYYTWTPRGYIYVRGRWDYPLAQRGLMFAPVYFQPAVYRRPNFVYTPRVVINVGLLSLNFFVRPNYRHYYFGDYYGKSYAGLGFNTYFGYHQSRFGYDPFYQYDRWNNRRDPGWNQRIQDDYRHRYDREDARPPRTYADVKHHHGRPGNQNQPVLDRKSVV